MNQLLTLFELPVTLLGCVRCNRAEGDLCPSRDFVGLLRYKFVSCRLRKTD
jgi:hypothetical protein